MASTVTAKNGTTAEGFEVPQLNIKTLKVRITGLSPLITHAWSEKAKKMIRDKQQKTTTSKKREAKVPEEEFQAAKYLDQNGKDAVKAEAFKHAMVKAGGRFDDNFKMTELRGALFVEGELVPIDYDECVMREDMVRISGKTTDLRYRPEYRGWRCEIDITYNPTAISEAQILSLLNLAGFSIGIFEWRPECNGSFGRFKAEKA